MHPVYTGTGVVAATITNKYLDIEGSGYDILCNGLSTKSGRYPPVPSPYGRQLTEESPSVTVNSIFAGG